MKEELIKNLEDVRLNLGQIKMTIGKIKSQQVAPSLVENEISHNCLLWSDKIYPKLENVLKIEKAILDKYHGGFQKLFKLIKSRNRKSSYLEAIKELLSKFHEELVQPTIFYFPEAGNIKELIVLLEDIPYPDQKNYLDEAIRCANADCLRGSIVLGWSAVMHHIHCKIEEIGFKKFNDQMEELKKKRGRFKSFSGFAPIESMNDIRETPDRLILVVLDGMYLIDPNEKRRLENCLDMRIHASHPGDAPIKFPNLVSFYSDLAEIVFKNPKFEI